MDTEPLAEIRAAAEAYVRAQLVSASGISKVSATALDERLRLARCAAPLQTKTPGGMALQGRPTVAVACERPVRWTVYVPVSVERRIAVLVLRHAVEREALLGAADVTVEMRSVTGLGSAYLSDVTELRGRFVRRTLAAGTTLTVDMLTPNYVVHRGQEVMLLAGAGGIDVRATGRALDDAAAGTRVKVQNLSSMKIVEGVAESADLVRVSP